MIDAMKHRLHILFVLLALPAFTACDEQKANQTDSAPAATATVKTATDAPERRAFDPLCFLGNEEMRIGALVDLTTCDPGDADAIQSPDYAPAKGFTGTAYRYENPWETNDDQGNSRPAFIEYKDLGATADGGRAVWTQQGDGGTAVSGALYILAEEDGKFRIRDIPAAGSGCADGIADAAIDGEGRLSYTINKTAKGLYDLAAAEKPFDFSGASLPATALDCTAAATFANGALETVRLTNTPSDTEDLTAQCFNDFAQSRIDAGKETLTPAALRDFLDEARTTCQIR